MYHIKASSLFFVTYLVLVFASVYINSFVNITPQIGLNIGALIITTLLVTQFKLITIVDMNTRIVFSIFGGLCSVINAYILAEIFDTFVEPTIIETFVTFIFNSIVMYITIYLSLKKA